MPKIKFNNNYPKLNGQKSAKLLMCISDLPERLLRTKYEDLLFYDTRRDDGKFYQAWQAGQKFLLLLFLGDKGLLFTTLRTDNEENRDKYAGFVGVDFEIIIED